MSSKRVAKRAAHEFVADLIRWELENNQSDALWELTNKHGFEQVETALREIESYHAWFSGGLGLSDSK